MRVGPLMMGFVPFTRRQARELADSPTPSSEDVARWHLQEEQCQEEHSHQVQGLILRSQPPESEKRASLFKPLHL